jgi:energy-coupling factor transporter transmembrane protein EcfT
MSLTLPAAARTDAVTAHDSNVRRRRVHPVVPEVLVAGAAFAALCVTALVTRTKMLEPDDYAYVASIVSLADGHFVLTTAQYHALSRQLGDGGQGIVQWTHLADGMWISQKNPGYPFLAVPFYLVGVLRLAPLFYGGLACAGLFVGGRIWLGRYGGALAVALYCTSGAALTFAWRDTMPSFTDASLVAAGAGFLLWTMLARQASPRRRLWAGWGAFACLCAATFVRYTDVVELGVAVVAVVAFARPAGLRWRTVLAWVGGVALFGLGVLAFDAAVYGSALATGYTTGQITFSLAALGPNLVHMPPQLVGAMPMAVPAAVAVGWVGWRVWRTHRQRRQRGPASWAEERRDGLVVGALVAGWAAIWGVYLSYTWTVGQNGGDPVHVIRFYLPAMGMIALLGAWTLMHLPRASAAPALVLALGLGIGSFHVMSSGASPGAGGRLGPGGPGAGAPVPGSGSRPGTGPRAGAGSGSRTGSGTKAGTGRPPASPGPGGPGAAP